MSGGAGQIIGAKPKAVATRLPPLTALKAFESAGRVLSFTLAAEELGVTPGAISRQIRGLEDYLGIQLFVRSGREVSLTEAGKEYLSRLTDAFALIRAATAQLTNVAPDSPLKVSTSITFTMRWLMPRLTSFQARHAETNLQLTMNLAAVDFQRDDLDATIKLGHEDTPNSEVRKLFDAPLIAVCSPRLLQEHGPITNVHDLARQTFLHSTAARNNLWAVWLAAAGASGLTGAHDLQFESSSLAYQAAIEGVGVAIAQLPLVLHDLRSGFLVAPIPIVAPDEYAYNLIWPNRTSKSAAFPAFRDWMMREARYTVQEVERVIAELGERRAVWERERRPD